MKSWQELLRLRFPEPAWHVLEEVRNSTGYAKSVRTADALVIGTWPSRGLELIGVEVKRSRNDWIRELRNPAKADEIATYCDHWFLLITDPKILRDEELPKQWGLLAPSTKGDKLVTLKAAPEFKRPKPLDRAFLAAIVRSARTGMIPRSDLDRMVGAEVQRQISMRSDDASARRIRDLEAEVSRLQRSIREFEGASSVRIHDRFADAEHAARVGRVFRLVSQGKYDHQRLAALRQHLHEVMQRVDQLAMEFPRDLLDGFIRSTGDAASNSGEEARGAQDPPQL